ncbi:MAG: hypothetical protein GY827_01185 [Cytophagales bacterium]|nr:hypothetical protein [Cytophagales bacterium]
MKKPLLILSTLLLIIVGIQLFASEKVQNKGIIGTWVYSDYSNQNLHYHSALDFDEDQSGICFYKDSTLVKRQNIGWCGTPPISYGNYKGTWKYTSDSTITIRYEYWGGHAEEDWLLIEVKPQVLKVKSLDYRSEPLKKRKMEKKK